MEIKIEEVARNTPEKSQIAGIEEIEWKAGWKNHETTYPSFEVGTAKARFRTSALSLEFA